jgi:hypothetical protein
MLDKIVQIIISSSSIIIGENVLFCQHQINDLEFISQLYEENVIENTSIDSYKVNDIVILEFSLTSLLSKGFYYNVDIFLKWNYYEFPKREIYIYELKNYLAETGNFKEEYNSIINLVKQIKEISKYSYQEDELLNSIIVREEKSLFLILKYSFDDLKSIDKEKVSLIESFIDILKSHITMDKKNIYLNQLVEFLYKEEEQTRFSYLIRNFDKYIKKSSATYNYYLRDFSYNKLKIELDSKALEFSQKLQSVINDSQTKLIAIPTALVFVLSTLDYENINAIKNYLALVGLILFCIFIQIFINNQKSAIAFIEENINYYKGTFKDDINEIKESFKKVELEKNKQIKRLFQIQILLWLIPIITISVLFFVNGYKYISIFIALIYISLSVFLFFWKMKIN